MSDGRADIKAQGKAIVPLFTEEKIVTERFWPDDEHREASRRPPAA